MTRRRINHLQVDKTLREFDPNELQIPGELDESKLGGNYNRVKPIIVMEADGKQYVVDGRHTARRAQLGEAVSVMGIVVGENDMVGRQTARERVEGMIRSKSRERGQ